MTFRKRNRLLKRVALGFAVAAVAVPTAQAHVEGVGSGAPVLGHASFTVSSPDTRDPFVHSISAGNLKQPLASYRDARGVQSTPNIVSPLAGYRDVRGVDNAPSVVSPIAQPVSSGGGFDWGDAGIGAGFAFGLAAAALVAARATKRLTLAGS